VRGIAAKKLLGSKGVRFRPKGRSIHPAMREFKRLFPQGTPFELAVRTEASVSFCDRVLRGVQQPGAPMLEALLRSDVGREMLIAVMGDARPPWWKGYRRHLTISELRRAQADHQRRIEALELEAAE
jgi:hypothetical protein